MKCEIFHCSGLSIDTNPVDFIKEEYPISISQGEVLNYMDYSDTGTLYINDSDGVLRSLWRRTGHWVPIGKTSDLDRIIGITDNKIIGWIDFE
jgi:hypothetical protein|mmetsp:Transcript_36802/g.6575  ORF Transcript_36802/g.6575 Transcript_36802/m.6575 type:complete len:93 (+) Transcript_36802:194-472(+)